MPSNASSERQTKTVELEEEDEDKEEATRRGQTEVFIRIYSHSEFGHTRLADVRLCSFEISSIIRWSPSRIRTSLTRQLQTHPSQ